MNIPPMPVLELTFQQLFEMKKFHLELEKADNEVLVEAALALQQNNYMLRNTISNLIHHWPNYETDDPGAYLPEEPVD